MLISTMNDIPGYEITEVLGEVFGLTVRARNAFSQLGAGFKSVVGGELRGMTKNLVNSREEVMARMVEEAQAKRAHLDSLVHYESSIHSLNGMLGYDVSGFDPDGPLPEIPETNASQSARERLVSVARERNLTIRQLAERVGGYGGLSFVGTAATIAAELKVGVPA